MHHFKAHYDVVADLKINRSSFVSSFVLADCSRRVEFSDTVLTFLGDNLNLLKNIVCLSADQNHEHWTSCNNNFWMRLSLLLLTFFGNDVDCVFQVVEVFATFQGPMLKLDAKC
jgi:hypothetical protein